MNRKAKLFLGASAALILASGVSMPVVSAPPTDWSAIPVTTVTLFYPGQGSYQWLRGSDHKRAYKKVIEGDSCVSCHEGEESDIGDLIVAGERLEPAPNPGKSGTIDLAVQVAYDSENAYFRFQWDTDMNRPGQMHNYMRFDGESWAFYGGPRSSEKVRGGAQPPLYEDRLAMMIDDGSVPMFAEQGCWLTCHQGMRDMPDMATGDQVKAHPLLGSDGLNKSDIRKFLPATRSDDGASWAQTRPAEELAQIMAAGGFVDLMQWRAARSNPVSMADDGYVFEYRLFDAGKKMFSWNVDRKTMTPKFMFDARITGMNSLTVDQVGDPAEPFAIIREENAAPYDPDAGWKEGDVLPGRLVSRLGAEGSAADNSDVKGVWNDGAWTVIWTRKMNTGHPEDDKILREGASYTFGFAIHDDNVTTRFHQVGFPLQIGFGAEGDIEATRVE